MPKPPAEPKEPSLLSEANITQREKIYDRANAERDAAQKPPETPAKTDDKPTPTDFKPAASAVPAKPAPAAASAAPTPTATPAKPGETPAKPTEVPADTGKKEERTVPLEALHEAREELKTLKQENKEFKDQIKTLLADIRELSKPSEPGDPGDGTVISDYDKELLQLKKELKDLRDKDQDRDKMTETERIKAGQQKLKLEIQETHVSLEKEGFNGFEQCLPMVITELQRMAATDKDAAMKLDNPDGWKKIFKETIHPRILELAASKKHEEKINDKVALKTDAGLLLPAAPAPAAPEVKEDEYSYEKYLEDRTKRSAQPQRTRK